MATFHPYRPLGDALRAARLRAGMTQREVAERARVHQSAYSEVERGTGRFGAAPLARVADVLDLDLAELHRLAGYEPPLRS